MQDQKMPPELLNELINIEHLFPPAPFLGRIKGTPLIYAATVGRVDMVNEFIRLGANVNCKTSGRNPLPGQTT